MSGSSYLEARGGQNIPGRDRKKPPQERDYDLNSNWQGIKPQGGGSINMEKCRIGFLPVLDTCLQNLRKGGKMKRLAMFVMVLALGGFILGCSGDKKGTKKAGTKPVRSGIW